MGKLIALWSGFKGYAVLIGGGLLAFLVGWLQVARRGKRKAQGEAGRQRQRAESSEENLRRTRAADRAAQTERLRGRDLEDQLELDRLDSKRPTGPWVDPRLQDD